MKILPIILLALSLSASAQTAKVIQLSPEDSVTAKSLQDEQTALDKRVADFHDRIVKNYLLVPGAAKQSNIWYGSSYPYKPGWVTGLFEYSDDFKFIVPKNTIQNSTVSGSCFYPNFTTLTGN